LMNGKARLHRISPPAAQKLEPAAA